MFTYIAGAALIVLMFYTVSLFAYRFNICWVMQTNQSRFEIDVGKWRFYTWPRYCRAYFRETNARKPSQNFRKFERNVSWNSRSFSKENYRITWGFFFFSLFLCTTGCRPPRFSSIPNDPLLLVANLFLALVLNLFLCFVL